MSVELQVLDDPAATCGALIVEVVHSGGEIVLTGGSTPRGAYAQAAGAGADWGGTTLWFGDERCVPPDDERSNYGMVRAALLDGIADGPPPTVKRIRGELGSAAGAERYERELRDADIARFDLVLLGLGSDGHAASLFPDAPELAERQRAVVGVPTAGLEPFVPRVSMTLPRLQRAERIVFLVSGEGKAAAVAAAFGGDAQPTAHVPASLVAAGADRVTVLLDPPAASLL